MTLRDKNWLQFLSVYHNSKLIYEVIVCSFVQIGPYRPFFYIINITLHIYLCMRWMVVATHLDGT